MSGNDKPRTRLTPARRQRQIVDAAQQVFWDRDPLDVTFEEVAEAAGVSRGLVYRYFGDKGGLVAAVYLRAARQLDDTLERAIDNTLPPKERLIAMVDAFFSEAAADAARFRQVTTLGSVHHPAVVAARAQRAEHIAKRFGGNDAARVVAMGIIGLLEAVAADWIDRGAPQRQATVETTVTLLWKGVPGLADAGVVIPPA